MIPTNARKISLDELPRYSPWPQRLLGLREFSVAAKTPENVLREYDQDKWGTMLRLCEERSLSDVTHLEAAIDGPDAEMACRHDGELFVMPAVEARGLYLDHVARRLEAFADASALVEFGCGYGSMLLKLAQRSPFSRLPITGAEFSPNGRRLFERLARGMNLPCQVAACDLNAARLTDSPIPKGALLCTIMTLPCIPNVGPALFEAFAAYEPKVVCHFEPIAEHAAEDSLLGLLTRRYIDFNLYAKGISTALRHAEQAGQVEVLHEEKAFFGLNPLLPVSMIAWRPR